MKQPISLVAAVVAFILVGAGGAAGGAGSGGLSFGAPPGVAYDESTILVGFAPGTSRAEEEQAVSDAQATDVETIGAGTHVLRVAGGSVTQKIAKLKSRASVRYAEPNYVLYADATPNDPRFLSGDLWGLRNTGQTINGVVGKPGADIGATSAWDVSTGGTSTVVAVIDTGVDYTHPDLAANAWSAPAAFTVAIGGKTITCGAGTHGFNAITNTCDPFDDNGHGSHVAGTIGAVGNNGVGVVGVNWTSRIMGSKFLDSSGSGTTANAINAIEFTIQAKQTFAGSSGANVRVLSNSWGGGGYSQALLDEINKANTNNMLFVAAAGNSGTNNDTTPHYPSSYTAPNVVSVAATDNTDALASFSNYGVSSVHLGAPGVDILSTIPGGYAFYSGTSMATPHVSGSAALVLSTCALDTSALKSNILNNVDLISSLAGKTVTGGRLNVNKAVRACSAPTAPPAAPANLTATPGDSQVRLAWTGSAGAASYTVKRSTTSGGPYAAIASGVTTTSYTDSGLTNGTTYYYVVSALNSLGESPPSNEVSATPQVVSDFSLSGSPTSQTVPRGAKAVYTVTVTPTTGFSGTVTFSVTGLPSGASATFSPASVTVGSPPGSPSSTTMTVTTSRTRGTFPLTITGTSGALVRTTGVTLIVTR